MNQQPPIVTSLMTAAEVKGRVCYSPFLREQLPQEEEAYRVWKSDKEHFDIAIALMKQLSVDEHTGEYNPMLDQIREDELIFRVRNSAVSLITGVSPCLVMEFNPKWDSVIVDHFFVGIHDNVSEPFVSSGRFYGYAECCIAAFLDRADSIFTGNRLIERAIWQPQIGFVPCSCCYDKPVEEVIAGITERRIYSVPFAEDQKDDYLLSSLHFLLAQAQKKIDNTPLERTDSVIG